MSYIGRGTDSISNVEVLDNLTFDGSASYTLQKLSTNFVPSSANNLLISISGVVQQGNFSVSGSTITFDTTVSASDTCDWILHYGTGLITTVADGAITEAKLGSNAVTTAKITDGTITNAKLQNSSITLNGSAVSLGGSATVGGSNTPAFEAKLSSSQSFVENTDVLVQFNTEEFDTDSAYNTSTYRFTPQTAGKYYVYLSIGVDTGGDTRLKDNYAMISKNGSNIKISYYNYQGYRIRFSTAVVSAVIDLNGSTDYVEARVKGSDNVANLSVASGEYSTFGAFRILE